MKTSSKLLAAAAATLSRLGSAPAQTVGMQASVPFQFLLGDKILPAGTYNFEIDLRSDILAVSNTTEFVSLVLAPRPVFRREKPDSPGRLSFELYESAHVLRKIWLDGELHGYLLPDTKSQRRLANQRPTGEVEVAFR